VLLLAFLPLALALPQGDERPDASAVDRVLACFESFPLVALAEQHRRIEVHDFLLALIEDPRFGRAVDDIVVEFGNALLQPVLDRYSAGDDVTLDELQHVWRDTGQWLVWDSPLYPRFFERVRAANLGRPPEERVRVVLGDPPIDWAAVKSAAEYRKFAERDAFYAGVVEREVLAKGRRALLIVGGMHLPRRGPLELSLPRTSPGVGALLSQRHPDALHIVWTLPPSEALADELGLERAPSYVELQDDERGERSYGLLVPRDVSILVGGEWKPMGEVRWPPMRDMVDALLYLGPEEHLALPDPAIYRDAVYQAELRRRAAILQEVYGLEFLPELETLLSAPAATGR
jgi:hypothetical protein